jgi:hypothetical protein
MAHGGYSESGESNEQAVQFHFSIPKNNVASIASRVAMLDDNGNASLILPATLVQGGRPPIRRILGS